MTERDYREAIRELNQIKDKADELYDSLSIDSLKENLAKLELETQKEEFWQDKEKFTKVSKEISRLKRKIEPWDLLITELNDSQELFEIAQSENDKEVLNEICDKIDTFNKTFDDLETRELLAEEDDFNNAFLTIHPGAGGTESQDWAMMLYRMYCRWGEKKGFSINIIDYSPGDEAGIKSATIYLKGDYAYGLLKGEQGVHRLVRISPFDANKKRHTSFASVEAVPELSEDIEIDVKESDLRIDTYRASGAGGQHVNKTDSAVRITHMPTGIVVQCQNERSQHKNKSSALKVLKSKLYELEKEELMEKKQEKIGEKKEISWANQIRSYVFQPYTMVKDHRTNEETGSINYVFDGDLDRFIYAYLKSLRSK